MAFAGMNELKCGLKWPQFLDLTSSSLNSKDLGTVLGRDVWFDGEGILRVKEGPLTMKTSGGRVEFLLQDTTLGSIRTVDRLYHTDKLVVLHTLDDAGYTVRSQANASPNFGDDEGTQGSPVQRISYGPQDLQFHVAQRMEFCRLAQKKLSLEGLLAEGALRLADPMISTSKRQKLTTRLAEIRAKIEQYQTRMLAFEGTLP